MQLRQKRWQVMPNACPWIIVTGEDYRFLVAQQAKETDISIGPILLEPSGRNTAPAVTLAAFEALTLHDSPKLLVQTADHYIKNWTPLARSLVRHFDQPPVCVIRATNARKQVWIHRMWRA